MWKKIKAWLLKCDEDGISNFDFICIISGLIWIYFVWTL